MRRNHGARTPSCVSDYGGHAGAPLRVHAREAAHASVAEATISPTSPSRAPPHPVSSLFVEETDVSSLLIKSEELLSILDTPPLFKATRTTLETTGPVHVSGAVEGYPALAWDASQYYSEKAAATPPEGHRPAALQSTAAAAAEHKRKKKKTCKQSKDPRSSALAQQREAVLKLEVELILLRQQQQSSAVVKTKRAQIWKELAVRQLRWRQLAETENEQLKTMMRELLLSKDPQHVDKYLGLGGQIRLSSHFHGPWKGAVSLSRNAARFNVFELLICSLDARFAEVDAVFRENGMDKSLTDSRTFAQKKSRRLGQPGCYLELVNMELSPFPWLSIGNTVWACNNEWHFKDAPYVHPCTDRPEDTFAVSYRVESKAGHSSRQQSVDFKMVMRRYVEANRIVLVYVSQSDGENDLAGASTSEVGYFAASSTSLLHEPNSPPVSVTQICMQISPQSSGGDVDDGAGDLKVKSLMKLVMGAFQDDLSHIRRQTNSLLLQHYAQTNCVSRVAVRKTMQHLDARVTFKHLDR